MLSPCSPAVADAHGVARRTSRLRQAALMWAALLCLTQPATAQSSVPKLTISDPIGSVEQGFSVAISKDGTTAIVGAPFDSSGTGAAWVFTRSGGTWTQQQKLTANDATGYSQLGWSVSLSTDGNTAIVGGPGDNGSIGAAWFFTRSGSGWSQQGSKHVGIDAVGSAEQGYSVALSGDGTTAIVGGWADDNAHGAVWFFKSSGSGTWNQEGSKQVGNGATDETNIMEGFSVALSDDGSTAIVGGPNDGKGVGAVWFFTQSDSGIWRQQGPKQVGTDGNVSQQGFSVALAGGGNTAIVGGPGDETPSPDTTTSVHLSDGAAWVFTRSGGVWSQQDDKLVGAVVPATSNPGKGFSVALGGGGNTALVGGPADNANTGAAWVFTNSGGGTWKQQGRKLVASNAIGTASQGASIALTHGANIALLGGPADNDFTGAAWVFTIAGISPVGISLPLSTHDFNGDGKSDILWRDSAGDVGVWLVNGASILQTAVSGNVPANWSAVGQRDFNGDGFADILWRDTAGDVGIWLMNGTQIISSTVVGNVPINWSVSATGDFNGDGEADIVWRDKAGDVGIWLMNGTSILQSAVVGNVSTSWVIAGADMNGDIFWRNTTTGEVGMWVMNGTQIAQTVDFGAVPPTWSIDGIGDFDGNGSTDILWRDTSGNVGVWLLNGTNIMSTSVIGGMPANWSVAATGDYNGDGQSDILWIDNAGNVGAWLMNGATISSVAMYGNVGTAWSVQSLNAD